MTSTRVVSTRHGDARLVTDRSRHPIATLLLNHGAGGGIDAADLEALAKALDECLLVAANQIRTRTPLVVGGRSAGARAAARSAKALGASGCLALAFPLHPPGKPEKSRLDELDGAQLPTLVIQGERDAFGRPEEFPERHDLTVVPGADHGFKVAKRGDITQEDALAIIVEATLEWIVREVVGNQNGG